MSKGEVTVSINGIDYPMACSPGEEEKVLALGAKIDGVARQISATSGAISEARILVMASLILTDKMAEMEEKLALAEAESSAPPPQADSDFDEERLVQMIDSLTARLEKLASQ